MDVITANIIEIPQEITADIIETPEVVSANISEPVVKTGIATYTINFDTNGLIWAFFSKNVGNIISVILTNVDSYTIDGNSESLPFAVSLNTTYLFEIIKTVPGTASMVITVEQSDITEVLNKIDFTTGDGRWTYLLGDTTANTTLLRYDNDLFTFSNYISAGSWTVNPLIATLTLPTLPANGYWSKILFLKDGYLLVSGGNTGNVNKYFCKVSCLTSTLDEIRDLDGNLNQYTQFSGTYNGYPKTQIYDYVNDKVHFAYRGVFTTVSIDDAMTLDLSTNTMNSDLQFPNNNLWGTINKVMIDPYQMNFSIAYITYSLDGAAHYKYIYSYTVWGRLVSRKENKIYISIDNDTRRVARLDHKGNFELWQGTSGTKTSLGFFSYDPNKEYIITHTRPISSTVFHKFGDVSKSYFMDGEEVGEGFIKDAMYMKDNLHISLSNLHGRIHLYDMTDILSNPEIGYIDMPVNCWHLYGNRLL